MQPPGLASRPHVPRTVLKCCCWIVPTIGLRQERRRAGCDRYTFPARGRGNRQFGYLAAGYSEKDQQQPETLLLRRRVSKLVSISEVSYDVAACCEVLVRDTFARGGYPPYGFMLFACAITAFRSNSLQPAMNFSV